MKNYRCLIVDDSPPSATGLQTYLSQLPFFLPAPVCPSPAHALAQLQKETFDLIFLDMPFPDPSAIRLLQATPKLLPIVVTSELTNFAADCYDLNITDYLLKPYSFPRFLRAINRALAVQYAPNRFVNPQGVFLKVGRHIQRFLYEEISYVEALASYSKVYDAHKVEVINESISSLEISLPQDRFIRVHKSFIVNVAKITTCSQRHVGVGSVQIPLGASYRERFEGFLSLLDKTVES